MSLVGPRPERPFFVEQLTQKIPFYAVRHSVKPGVTGWAQVRYQYGATVEDSQEKLQYDLYYVKNHTLFLDFVVLLETVGVVLTGQGRSDRGQEGARRGCTTAGSAHYAATARRRSYVRSSASTRF